jgi:hypothetical protein
MTASAHAIASRTPFTAKPSQSLGNVGLRVASRIRGGRRALLTTGVCLVGNVTFLHDEYRRRALSKSSCHLCVPLERAAIAAGVSCLGYAKTAPSGATTSPTPGARRRLCAARLVGRAMVNRDKVTRALLPPGIHIMWLDQVFPWYRKIAFEHRVEIGLTLHRPSGTRCLRISAMGSALRTLRRYARRFLSGRRLPGTKTRRPPIASPRRSAAA